MTSLQQEFAGTVMAASPGGTCQLSEQHKLFWRRTKNASKSPTHDGFRAITDLATGEIFHSPNQTCYSVTL